MKAKHLKAHLQKLDDFRNPRVELEQYSTPLDIAVAILQHIDDRIGGFDECTVADLGCGTGVFLIGAALLGSPFSVGVDCDSDALSVAATNIDKYECTHVTQLIQANVRKPFSINNNLFDIVITNPPFGTKNNQGADIDFVLSGLNLLRQGGKVFSLHKSSTRDFLLKKASKWPGIHVDCIAEMNWNLESTYKFHRKKSVDITVDLICFEKVY